MKKIVVAIMLFVLACLCLTGCQIGNRQIGFDTKQRFDEAIIVTPTYEVVSGDIEAWRDFSESDVVQVTIDGVTYLTHYSNVMQIKLFELLETLI